MQDIINVSHVLGHPTFSHTSVGNIKVAISIQDIVNSTPKYALKLIVIVDTSGSMDFDNKLTYLKAVLEYTLDNLSDEDHLCLIEFNSDATVLSNGFVAMTKENKLKILELIKNLNADGGTNMINAIKKAEEMLDTIDINDMSVVTSILFLTDGLDNSRIEKPVNKHIKETTVSKLNNIISINTFGFGSDHDSKILSDIALSSNGLYYYIPTAELVGATFGQCLAGLNNTIVSNMQLTIKAYKGCRIVNIMDTRSKNTKVEKHIPSKNYTVYLGNLFKSESHVVILTLSLDKVDQKIQDIFSVTLSYVNTTKGTKHDIKYGPIQIQRDTVIGPQVMNPEITKHINRIETAQAIDEALDTQDSQVLDKILKTLRTIEDKDLIEDLNKCKDLIDKQCGIHTGYSYATMHYSERSTGFMPELIAASDVESSELTTSRYTNSYTMSGARSGLTQTHSYTMSDKKI